MGTLGTAAYIRQASRDEAVSDMSRTGGSSISYAQDMSTDQIWGRNGEVRGIFFDGESDKYASELKDLVWEHLIRREGSCFCICRIAKVKEGATSHRGVVLIYTRTADSQFALVKSIDVPTNRPVDTVAYAACLKEGANGVPLYDTKYLRTKDLQRLQINFGIPLHIEAESYVHRL